MAWQIVAADEQELLLSNGEGGYQCIPWQTLASWGALLNEDDPAEVLGRVQAVLSEDEAEPDWASLYQQLRTDLARPKTRQAAARVAPMRQAMTFGPLPPIAQAIADHAGIIEQKRAEFIGRQQDVTN